jgi:hypothetical protein
MILLNIAVENSEMFIVEFREYKIPDNKISPYCKTYAALKLLTQFEHLKIHEKYNLGDTPSLTKNLIRYIIRNQDKSYTE